MSSKPRDSETNDLISRLDDCIRRDREARAEVEAARAQVEAARQETRRAEALHTEAERRAERTGQGIDTVLRAIHEHRAGGASEEPT
jgi:ATP/maltotriose-dependent transcriptional regulator MalT